MSEKRKRCGDYGGRRDDGKPCRERAGYGRRSARGRAATTGPCYRHTEQVLALRRQRRHVLAKQLVEAVRRTGTLTKACEALDVDRTGVYEWILDPEFRDYWDQIQIVRHELDPVRAAFVEDAMIQRSIEGKATGTETIFYLINRLPHKYRNTKDVRVSGAVGVLGLIQQLPKEEAQRLLQLSAPEFEREIVRLYASAQARDDEPGD